MTSRTTHLRARATLERQAIGFTIGLYLFITISLLALHYLAPMLPQVTPDEAAASLSTPASSTTALNTENEQ